MTKRKPMVKHPQDFKNKVLARVDTGEVVTTIAKDMGIHPSLIYSWMKKAGILPVTSRQGPRPSALKTVRNDTTRDAIIYLTHARTEILKLSEKRFTRVHLLTMLALDTLQGG